MRASSCRSRICSRPVVIGAGLASRSRSMTTGLHTTNECCPSSRTWASLPLSFLSGRALHGLGPLWFERLDCLVAAEGTRAVGRRLGLDTDDPERLALACENDLSLQERVNLLPDLGVRHLSSVQIRALADAGMTIGFHTLHHPLLSMLADSALDDALARGRGELEEAAGRPIRLFAYPHGKADGRVAQRLRSAGFVAACTGRPRPVRPGDDPYLLGRWEPGPVALDGFVARVAARVNGWSAA